MRARASQSISLCFLSVIGLATGALAGCHHGPGMIMTDTTLLPYKAPDIDDITGIDSDAPADDATPAAAPAPAAPAAPATPPKGTK